MRFSEPHFRLRTKSSKKLSLGEGGRQRPSKKFHDLVLNLKFQNSRVPETIMFQALFSRRKILVDDWIIQTNKFFYFCRIFQICKEEQFVYALKMRLSEPHFLWKWNDQLVVRSYFCKKIRVNKKIRQTWFLFFSFIVVNSEPLNTSKARTNR